MPSKSNGETYSRHVYLPVAVAIIAAISSIFAAIVTAYLSFGYSKGLQRSETVIQFHKDKMATLSRVRSDFPITINLPLAPTRWEETFKTLEDRFDACRAIYRDIGHLFKDPRERELLDIETAILKARKIGIQKARKIGVGNEMNFKAPESESIDEERILVSLLDHCSILDRIIFDELQVSADFLSGILYES